jgi:hypothetical protein
MILANRETIIIVVRVPSMRDNDDSAGEIEGHFRLRIKEFWLDKMEFKRDFGAVSCARRKRPPFCLGFNPFSQQWRSAQHIKRGNYASLVKMEPDFYCAFDESCTGQVRVGR